MFVGHYGVALAAKRVAPSAPLGALFVAVQLIDVLFALFVLAGVEKMRVVPGFTATNPYDLYFMPYTHSLVGATAWAALAALAYGAFAKGDPRTKVIAALAIALAVLSHFALDYLVHKADLPLGFGPDSPKVGLDLWDQPDVTVTLEVGTFVAGAALYLEATRARDGGGDRAFLAFAAVLVALAFATPFLPNPPSVNAWAVQALVVYAGLAAMAAWIDGKRARVPSQ